MRVAVVSGGIGGLGTEICRHLARSGRQVVAADLASRPERIEAFQAELAEFNGQVVFEPLDVADPDSCQSLADRVQARFGRLDILVNAAGITRDASFRKMEASHWSDVMRINLDGVFNLTRPVVDGMCDRGFGRIVNISSVNGQTGQFGQTNYAAAKAGVHGFTMALAREVAAKGITVNSVAPGYCDTPMVQTIPAPIREKILEQIPVGRIAQPGEIARVVDFLAAEGSGYITGALVPVNGGLFISF